jgi:hypothetical protein
MKAGAISTCAICSARLAGTRTTIRRRPFSARGVVWNVRGDGCTSIRAGYGLYFNTNNHQNLIVTVTGIRPAPAW